MYPNSHSRSVDINPDLLSVENLLLLPKIRVGLELAPLRHRPDFFTNGDEVCFVSKHLWLNVIQFNLLMGQMLEHIITLLKILEGGLLKNLVSLVDCIDSLSMSKEYIYTTSNRQTPFSSPAIPNGNIELPIFITIYPSTRAAHEKV
ncbi:hypothetical protein QVD17_00707 [Tagetes erecta]|uniref:Uncharacterized protein n=1 Tax=Tagetes erecta TaxID=13708 RepID=A0AAD8LAQ5_TARER|nr:hypothetical protein QVD17_00707 [Tagetes erecta]